MTDNGTSIADLNRQLPPVLSAMHSQAAALRYALERVQESSQPWESYLLQPDFAEAAALLLAQPFEVPFRLAGTLYSQLDYSEGAELGDARFTLQIPGLLAVPHSVIELAQQLNQSKVQFQQITNAFKARLADRPALERDARLRGALADAGFPRAHLRQCYRQILVCVEKPDGIALSWIKARKSIRKVSVEWCEKKLVQLDPMGEDPGIQFQRQRLAGLHPQQHDSLRQVQVQSRPNLQVAEIFHREQQDDYRQVGYSAMPVLVNGGDNRRLPEFTRVEHAPPASRRRQRRDLRISAEAYLPALRVHLHLGETRAR